MCRYNDDDLSLAESQKSQRSYASGTSHSTSQNMRCSIPKYVDPKVAEKEQTIVTKAKILMIGVLLVVAAALCTSTYFILKNEEQDNFEQQFVNYASEIVAVSTEHVKSTFLTIEAFSNTISSYARDARETWPNVTVPDYTSRAERVSQIASGARLVTMAPVVTGEERLGFEEYTRNVIHDQIQEDLDYQGIDMNATDLEGIPDRISYLNLTAKQKFVEPDESPGPYLVNWQRMPFETPKKRIFVMNNMMRIPTIKGAVTVASATLGPKVAFFEGILGVESQVIQPIYQDVFPPRDTRERKMVGAVWLVMGWGNYFQNLLPENESGIHLVLESSCGFVSTYLINGLEAEFLGLEDLHDPKYNHLEISAEFFSFGEDIPEEVGICVDQLTLHLYPSDTLRNAHTSTKPAVYTSIVASIFVFTSAVFLIYDWSVRRRQTKVMARIITQDKIVSNLFPATIRDRLYGIGDRMNGGSVETSSLGGGGLLDSNDFENQEIYGSKPIADLFLETTVVFADIAGFTAWSSAREPSQVFTLLENIYGAFDKLARRHGVFKVETIGDCYVAVTGLPDPRKDHAVAMAKFARGCMDKMESLTKKLEVTLGPDTGDLDVRIGIHSGQVTAGVLRGERSRFQLFGDTVNTAARMESTGIRQRIHISNITAELLQAQGRAKWVRERDERVAVHGKGMMQTCWLETTGQTRERQNEEERKFASAGIDKAPDNDIETSESTALWDDEEDDYENGQEMSKKQRVVEWNVEILSGLLNRILAARADKKPKQLLSAEKQLGHQCETVLEEFKEIITLPKVTMADLKKRKDPDFVMLDHKVVNQLRDLISKIADMYNENAFHNFEHASHVTASVAKLLSRIVKVDTTNQTQGPKDLEEVDLAGHSYGITSDPLTQFTVVFSAIIHDADHPGVPNTQLVKEKVPMAEKYKDKSIAEQNSVDLVWDLLMKAEYMDLRSCIYADEEELRRFRQLLVNVVMATDICDKELGALRKARWARAFSETPVDSNPQLAINRKATIVLEHLIQASDVSHTMQHWQVYRKWNARFFNEMYGAYKAGRAETDPSEGWYKGEIGFFDFYVIPLAKKLDSCGVFGVSSHEYLNYATVNRDEWVRNGESLVVEYLANYDAEKS